MTLRLVIEHAPHPQPRTEIRLADGVVTIGRGTDCEWQIDDPDMFISRRHCVVTGRGGQYTITDESRAGLFLNGADTPLGAGVTADLAHGLRLRLGDVVIRAEIEADIRPTVAAAPSQTTVSGYTNDDFFSPRPDPAPAPPRPEGLPQPFDLPSSSSFATPDEQSRRARPPSFDDPFALGPIPRREGQLQPVRAELRQPRDEFGSSNITPEVTSPAPSQSFDWADFDLAHQSESTAEVRSDASPAVVPAMPTPISSAPPAPISEIDTRIDDFLRGLAISAPPGFKATPQEMEALGRRFRVLTEGLVQLLRARSREKGSARVAQTVIGSSDVNPLKFLATTDDALAAIVAPRGPGYLDPDAALAAAFIDLQDHQRRTWIGLQSALRKMIDRFDPAMFEAEVEDVGLLKALVSGSRSARLWQLYCDRYRDIAKAAEDRFLGEVGADFREAYEGNRRTKDD